MTESVIKKTFAVYVITKHGMNISDILRKKLPDADYYISKKFMNEAPDGSFELSLPMGPVLKETFKKYDCHVFIISVGAVVRMIKDLMEDKKTDPAVICVDDASKFSICVLSGHVGRGNEYTQKIADILGAISVVTTASDRLGTLMVDILGRDLGWTLDDPNRNVTRASADVVNETKVAFVQEAGEPDFWPIDKNLPANVAYFTQLEDVNPEDYETLLIATDRNIRDSHPAHWSKSVIYRPKSLILGLGCDKDTPSSVIENGILHHLKNEGLDLKSVKACATIDLKKEEPGLLDICRKYNWPLITYSPEELDAAAGIENPSEVVKKYTGSRTVAEGACLLYSGAEYLLVAKRSYKDIDDKHNMTFAAARIQFLKRKNISL